MNNFEIIEMVEKIVNPYFEFSNMYEDPENYECPQIQDRNVWFFKLNDKNKKTIISKDKQIEIVNKVKELNIGYVSLSQIQSIGTFIYIELHNTN